jgi:hypothetical protein
MRALPFASLIVTAPSRSPNQRGREIPGELARVGLDARALRRIGWSCQSAGIGTNAQSKPADQRERGPHTQVRHLTSGPVGLY